MRDGSHEILILSLCTERPRRAWKELYHFLFGCQHKEKASILGVNLLLSLCLPLSTGGHDITKLFCKGDSDSYIAGINDLKPLLQIIGRSLAGIWCKDLFQGVWSTNLGNGFGSGRQ